MRLIGGLGLAYVEKCRIPMVRDRGDRTPPITIYGLSGCMPTKCLSPTFTGRKPLSRVCTTRNVNACIFFLFRQGLRPHHPRRHRLGDDGMDSMLGGCP